MASSSSQNSPTLTTQNEQCGEGSSSCCDAHKEKITEEVEKFKVILNMKYQSKIRNLERDLAKLELENHLLRAEIQQNNVAKSKILSAETAKLSLVETSKANQEQSIWVDKYDDLMKWMSDGKVPEEEILHKIFSGSDCNPKVQKEYEEVVTLFNKKTNQNYDCAPSTSGT